jgi:hypothetical protein
VSIDNTCGSVTASVSFSFISSIKYKVLLTVAPPSMVKIGYAVIIKVLEPVNASPLGVAFMAIVFCSSF